MRGHLQRLAAGMRTLLRFYYRLTLALGPLMMLFNFGLLPGPGAGQPAPLHWPVLLRMAGVSVVAAIG